MTETKEERRRQLTRERVRRHRAKRNACNALPNPVTQQCNAGNAPEALLETKAELQTLLGLVQSTETPKTDITLAEEEETTDPQAVVQALLGLLSGTPTA